jgi:signal transduction histidine kinase
VVSDAAARTLYFVAAEGLSNAIKHGGATTVTFHLTADGDGVELRVDDDGDGTIFLRPGGGLVGLSDRLAAEGGILRCERRPSGGSTVRAWLPEGGLQPIGSQAGIVQRSV